MPQVLKEHRREKIIQAARSELLKNGAAGVSMRTIADEAGMTVGNLYRYFKNKEQLIFAVVEPVLQTFDLLLTEIVQQQEKLFLVTQDTLERQRLLGETLNVFADELVALEDRYQQEMSIIINDAQIGEKYSAWFCELIRQMVDKAPPCFLKEDVEKELLIQMISKAIFGGLNEAIRTKATQTIDKEAFRTILRFYLQQGFSLMNFTEAEPLCGNRLQ